MPKARPTHYERLKVQPDAPAIVIRAAYRALAFHHHPDRRGPDSEPQDHEEMAHLNAAYQVLMDPTQRLRYDAELASQAVLTYEPAPFPAPPADPPTHAYPVAERNSGPKTRVDLDWPELDEKPSQRISSREWKLVAAIALLTLGGASWMAVQEHRRAHAEQALAARMAGTLEPPPAAVSVDGLSQPGGASAPLAPLAPAGNQGAFNIALPDTPTAAGPTPREEQAAAGQADPPAAEASDPAAARAVAEAPEPAAHASATAADAQDLLERAPTGAGRPAQAASAAVRPIFFHPLDGKPLTLKSAADLPETQQPGPRATLLR